VEPLREEAERVAKRYLEKRGLGQDRAEGAASANEANVESPRSDDASDERAIRGPNVSPARGAAARVVCSGCETSNEFDATFCKKCGAPLGAPKTEETVDASS